MREVWESYKFYVQKMKEDSSDDPHPTLSLEKDDVLRQPYYNYAREDRHHPGSYRVLKALYLFNFMSSPPKNMKRLKTKKVTVLSV